MAVDFHRHCQITVLSANGTGSQNGESWSYISDLKDDLKNLPSDWINDFKDNKTCITEDFASILKILDSTVKKYLPLDGGTMIGDLILNGNPETYNQAATKKYVDDMVQQKGSGTITGIIMNGTSKGTDGEVDLGHVVSSIKINGNTKTPDANGLVDIGSFSAPGFSITNTDNNGSTISRINYNGTSYDIKMPPCDCGGSGGGEGDGIYNVINNPVGTIIAWTGNTSNTPKGYLVCDGSEVSQTEYSELFAVIGSKFGEETEEGKFKLPKLDNERYLQGNMNSGEYIESGLPSISGQLSGTTNTTGEHTHTYTKITTYKPRVKNDGAVDTMISSSSTASTGSSGNQSHTIDCDINIEGGIYGKSDTVTPKSMTVIYLICAKVITPSVEQSSFDPSKLHTVFFNPADATSIEFTNKSLYEGSRFGRLPTYTVNGESKNEWYLNGTLIDSDSTFNSNADVELTIT